MELMQREIKYLEGCHDPDHDQSRVSWVDVRMLSLIKDLLLKVESLEGQIEVLEEKVEAMENPSEYKARMWLEVANRRQ